jgi:F0F1-type ATP synthase assembly protein I
MTPPNDNRKMDRARQAKAWVMALDPLYGMVGFGAIGYAIDHFVVGSGRSWMLGLGITGLVAGFYRFIREAMALNREQTQSSSRTDGDPET